MLADDVVVEDFGLKVVVNSITPTSLRRITKVNIGGNQKSSNEQLPLESDIDDFGFDIERDLISTVTGHSDDDDFMTGIISGSNLLSLTAEVDITNLAAFLSKVYTRYLSEKYKESFGWIDHIRRVKSKRLIDRLNAELISLINMSSPKIWMAVPDVIEWEKIKGFRYVGKELYNDIDLPTLVTKGLHSELVHIGQGEFADSGRRR